jgi:peptidoglycan/LPS O-acetylase OafA/YrhL
MSACTGGAFGPVGGGPEQHLYARPVPTTDLDTPAARVVAAAPEVGARSRFRYQPSLDGMRALAVLAIIAFHLNYVWARGAFLGVDLFFVLSGFLITTLLVIEWHRTGRIALAAFWGRRARRLLPALMLVLVLVAIFTRLEIEPWNRAAIRGDGIASLFYVGNWRFIAEKQGYFSLFSAPSPLRHMWSLAIEEQFYLVWPLVVFATMRLARGSLRVLALVCGAGIAASVAAMAALYGPGEPLRAYYGTDARAHTILLGALLAVLLVSWTPGAVARRRLATAGAVALGAIFWVWHVASGTSERYYRGGSVLYAVLACIAIAGALQAGLVQRALSWGPLVWIGRISYGLYLFHWPIIVWLVPTRVHVHGVALNALRVALTFLVATVSYYVVELPIRERRRPAIPWRVPQPRAPASTGRRAGWLVVPAIAVTLAIVIASNTGATAAPSYLSGTRTPSFTLPPAAARAAASVAAKSARSPRPVTSVTFAVPKVDFVWGFGDPLYCGEPRPDETRAAVDEARSLGPPVVEPVLRGARVLVLGDSTACSFYPGIKVVGNEVGAVVAQAAVFGCGMASGEVTTTRGEQITPHSDRCPEMVAAAQLPAIEQMRPDVVIWMSIWEKSDVVANGQTLVSGTPAGDDEMLHRMDTELARITEYGAKVALVTVAAPAPNDAEGASNTSNTVDNASYARLDSIDRRFAQRHPGVVTLIDLAHRLCPDGPPCPEDVDGLRMRPDGRHFTPQAAATEAQWLVPQLARLIARG